MGWGGMGLHHAYEHIELSKRFDTLELAAVSDLHESADRDERVPRRREEAGQRGAE